MNEAMMMSTSAARLATTLLLAFKCPRTYRRKGGRADAVQGSGQTAIKEERDRREPGRHQMTVKIALAYPPKT